MGRNSGHVMFLPFRVLSTTSFFRPADYNSFTLLAVSIGFPRLAFNVLVICRLQVLFLMFFKTKNNWNKGKMLILSQVPPELIDKKITNKGKIYLSKTSSPALINAYASQFQRDFSLFLKLRAEEIVPGGRMVFSLKARRIADPVPDESCLLWDLLAQALQELVSEVCFQYGHVYHNIPGRLHRSIQTLNNN